jgi:hypothetical protein
MGIGCDHLLSGRGRRDFALLRYLVLLSQLKRLCQLHVGCAWPTPELYSDRNAISSLDTVDFSDKTSEVFVVAARGGRCAGESPRRRER